MPNTKSLFTVRDERAPVRHRVLSKKVLPPPLTVPGEKWRKRAIFGPFLTLNRSLAQKSFWGVKKLGFWVDRGCKKEHFSLLRHVLTPRPVRVIHVFVFDFGGSGPKMAQNGPKWPFLTLFDPVDQKFIWQANFFMICMDKKHKMEGFFHSQDGLTPHPARLMPRLVPTSGRRRPFTHEKWPKRAKMDQN